MTDTDTTATAATETAVPAPTSKDAAETPTVGTDTPGEAESGAAGENEGAEPRGRAAQYRKRAQDAEAARDEALQQVTEHVAVIERLQQRLVERVVAEAGVKVAAVLAVSPLADLLGEDGLPDAGKIESAIDAARDQLGVRRHEHPLQRQLGMRSGAGAPQPKRDGWAAAFARRDD